MTAYAITHPEVDVDPAVPVPQWGLSPAGRARVEQLLRLPWTRTLVRVVSSTETKAVQTARALAGPLGLPVLTDPELGENDRSATGFVPPAEFEQLADAFFARPEDSVHGWERAVEGAAGDVAVVAHGGVGTLLWCRLAGVRVDRRHDQPGQGSWFAFEPPTGQPAAPWARIGAPPAATPAAGAPSSG